jgi:hypothetical protein
MFEDEIPKELVPGEKYSGKQIFYFLAEYSGRRIILSAEEIRDHLKYTVTNVIERFVHHADRGSVQIPASISVIYEVIQSSQ